jgi:uncharacterized protein YndB with AHSA1/START domain
MVAVEKVSYELKEKTLNIRRQFDAHKNVVFQVWTEPKYITYWWGPQYSITPICEVNFHVGGEYRLAFQMKDGVLYPIKGLYKEIIKNEKIIYTVNLEGHPKSWKELILKKIGNNIDESPWESFVTVSFIENDTKTEVTISSVFKSNAIRDAFYNLGMVTGWSESLEKLDDLLVK